jgi:hypothetical protein
LRQLNIIATLRHSDRVRERERERERVANQQQQEIANLCDAANVVNLPFSAAALVVSFVNEAAKAKRRRAEH